MGSPNNKPLIPRLQRVRRRLTDGTSRVHLYHRPTKTPLPPLDDPNFVAAYETAERQFAASRLAGQSSVAAPSSAPKPRPEPISTSDAPDADNPHEVYYTPDELVRRWRSRIDVDTLKNWRSKRQGPTYHRFGRVVLYRSDLLAEWEKKNMIVCDPLAVTDSEAVEV